MAAVSLPLRRRRVLVLRLTPATGASGGILMDSGTKFMKKIVSILVLLACLTSFGQVSYYGSFYGNGAGLTNLPSSGGGLTTAATLTVDPSGIDYYGRKTNSAYQTFACAASNAIAGDTIKINAGYYQEQVNAGGYIQLTNNITIIA